MKKQLLLTACLFLLTKVYSQCNMPELEITAQTDSSVTISWNPQIQNAVSFEYAIQTWNGGFPDTSPLEVFPAATAPLTLTSYNGQPFQPFEAYRIFVRTRCAANETSDWQYVYYGVPPLNDECSGAVPLPVNPSQEAVLKTVSNTANATASGTQSDFSCPQADVWFSFVATATAHTINFTEVQTSDTIRHGVFSGTCGNLTNLYCRVGNLSIAKDLTIGETYFINASSTYPANLTIAITSPPSNDECTNAITVGVNPYGSNAASVTGSTFGASGSLPAGSTQTGCFYTDDDMWYSFTATSATAVIKLVNLVGATSLLNHSLYGGNCGNMTLLYCSSPDLSIATNLVIGNEYKIRVYTSHNSDYLSSNFKLFVTAVPPITNDECSNSTVLPVQAYSENAAVTSGMVTGATSSTQPSACTGTNDDIWYSFTATNANQILEFSNIQGSAQALGYALYSGNCASLTQISCKTTITDANEITNLTVGTTYKLRVFSTGVTPQDITFDLAILKPVAPIIVGNQFTVNQLVNDILLDNPCITASNITFSTGLAQGILGLGYFTANNSGFAIDSGIVLATGAISGIPGPNTTVSNSGTDAWLGDAQLDQIILQATGTSMNSKNATKLEFDFTTANAYMSFNFLFASEEYGQFQCTFSDAFAFLLTDMTTGITTNLAVVPNTTIPVSTVTIRDGVFNTGCPSANAAFFDKSYGDNTTTGAPGLSNYLSPTNFNGITKLMTASAALIPNNPYHIKLVVADRQDTQFDSAVFLQAGSFTSGPPECSDKIRLVSFVDTNGNGTKEDNESSFTYGSFVYQLNDTPEINTISSPIGNYTLYDSNPLNSYDFSFAVNPEYQAYFSVAATNFTNVHIPAGSGTTTLYFPVTLVQGYNDVTVSIVPVSPPVAGMSFKNKIVYTNHGVIPASGTITFTKDPVSTIESVSQSGTVSMPGGFTYDFTNLAPFESRSIDVVMTIPPIPTVNIDDVLSNNVTIAAPADDINSSNNAFVNTQIVVASYDPNDKMEAHGEKIQFSSFNQNDYLTYTIRFQNTGTSNAINIRLEDLLDAQFDESSIRMIAASHNYVMKRVGNKVIWYFDYIQLPGMIVNEALSHGYVTFNIKLKPGFTIGDIVPNNADIYFDTNPPITTNTFRVEFVTQLGTPTFETSNIVVYPNPGNGNIQISMAQTNETIRSIVLYDVLGKCVKKKPLIGSAATSLNVSDLSQGIYMMEITTGSGLKTTKKLIVK